MNYLFPQEKVSFNLSDAEIDYYPGFFASDPADDFFLKLLHEIPWQKDSITIFGKTHPQPRLTALFGNEGKDYSYSGITMHPHPWTPLLMFIKNEIEEFLGIHFTTVLLNLYRDGNDSNGWHADDEKELGINPIIASVSFGASRSFHLRHNLLSDEKLKLVLDHGSLLIMKGPTQHFWKHQVPKTAKKVGPRINLTFRVIK